MNDYLRAWIVAVPARVVGAYDMQIDERQVPAMARSLERVLVEWMGPGGDEAFLQMFALANGPMDLPIENLSSSGPMTREAMARDVRFGLRFLARDVHEKQHDGQRHVLDGTSQKDGYEGHESEWTEYLTTYAFEKPYAFLVARRVYVGNLPFTILATPRNGTKEPMKRTMSIVVEPRLGFRTALMGELAAPWDIPEGPFEGTYLDPRYETGTATR